MWLIVMFDLPTDTREARKAYQNFRELLLDEGFMMLQFSVYARHCGSDENAIVHEHRVQLAIPLDGEVRIIAMTDKQFDRMKVFLGKQRKATEKGPVRIRLTSAGYSP